MSAIITARRERIGQIAVDPARLATYNARVQNALRGTVWNSGCTSYFLDKNGRNSTNWPWTTFHMRRRLGRFVPRDFITEPRKP